MKFSNGCWLQKERCECFSPAEVYFSKIEKDQVTICAPTSKITQRGDTLGGINLTIVISAPYEEVLRVQTYHHMGVQKKAPSFEIAPAESGHLKAEDTEDKLVISSGTLRLEVQKENGALTFYRGEEKITASGWRDLGSCSNISGNEPTIICVFVILSYKRKTFITGFSPLYSCSDAFNCSYASFMFLL